LCCSRTCSELDQGDGEVQEKSDGVVNDEA